MLPKGFYIKSFVLKKEIKQITYVGGVRRRAWTDEVEEVLFWSGWSTSHARRSLCDKKARFWLKYADQMYTLSA